MKKILPLFLVLALIFCSVAPVFAMAPRSIDTKLSSINLNMNGSNAVCYLQIEGLTLSTPIKGTLYIRCGNIIVGSWGIDTAFYIDQDYKCSAPYGGTYTASFEGYCGRDNLTGTLVSYASR